MRGVIIHFRNGCMWGSIPPPEANFKLYIMFYLFYEGEIIDSSDNEQEAQRLANEYVIAFGNADILIDEFDYDVEDVKEYYLNQGAFHLDFPDCEEWTDWDWLDTAETSDLILDYNHEEGNPDFCKFCNSQEVTYNQSVMDSYCADCGSWQEDEEFLGNWNLFSNSKPNDMKEKLFKILHNLEDYLEYDRTTIGKELGNLINELQGYEILINKK